MKRVVVTRSEGDVDRLAERLTLAGHLPVKLPLLAIEATQASVAIGDIPVATTTVIYTSVNAVRYGFEKIAKAVGHEQLPTIAVGSKTRHELYNHGARAESPSREDSEGVLALLERLPQFPTHVLLVKGEGGRDLIETSLAPRGIHLSVIECYRRVWPDISESAFASAMSTKRVSVIHVASGETLIRLTNLCRAHGIDAVKTHYLVVPSQRVADQARELGWHSRIVADGAGDEALLEVLAGLT